MLQHPHLDDACRPLPDSLPGPLFGWSGGGVVLLGERDADRWVVARGWRRDDRLSDVRRWSFAEPRAFAGQIRRLALEATGDHGASRAAGDAALAWSALAR